jgi:ribosome recycling factor
MMTLEECIKAYGEENGTRIYNHWQDTLKRIRENPTTITIPPRDYVKEISLILPKMTHDERMEVVKMIKNIDVES